MNYRNLYYNQKHENNILHTKIINISEQNNKLKRSITSSLTAINGYLEETKVINDLNGIIKNPFNKYLITINKKVHLDNFFKINGYYKSDITNGSINIQVKKYKISQFGHIDRHWINDFIKNIPSLKSIQKLLKGFCEKPLRPCKKYVDRNKKINKLSQTNYSNVELKSFVSVLNNNKRKILNYVLLGNDNNYMPHFLCGVLYKDNMRRMITIYNILDVIYYLLNFDFEIKKSCTVIKLGPLSLQRKGGDSGKKTSNQIQTKLVFSELNINQKFEYHYTNSSI
jgi:hypothetical protein